MMHLCVRACTCLQYLKTSHDRHLKGYMMVWKFCQHGPNGSAVIVVCGNSGKDQEDKVEGDRGVGKEREGRMWKNASQMA